EVQLFGRAFPREAPEAPERHPEIPGAELDAVVEVPELAPVPHLHRAEVAVPVLADAHALGIVAPGAEGRGAGGADPFRAALVALLLLGEALAQRLHELLPAAERLDLRLLLFGEVPLGQLPQPFLGNLGRLVRRRLEPLED